MTVQLGVGEWGGCCDNTKHSSECRGVKKLARTAVVACIDRGTCPTWRLLWPHELTTFNYVKQELLSSLWCAWYLYVIMICL